MDQNSDKVNSRYLVEIETAQPTNLKSAFSVLKEQISEGNIEITPDHMEILQMDSTHIVIAHIQLKASNFEKYNCKKPIKIGIDLPNLTKILKGVGAKDILTFFVEDPSEKANSLGSGEEVEASQLFGIRIENIEKGQVSTVYIDTIDINDEECSVPNLDYPYNIYMPSSDLQAIVNNHKSIGGEIIQIRYVKENLYFYTKGDLGRLETVRSKTKDDTSIKVQKNGEDTNDIIEIYVKLAKLVEFSKCSSMTPMATIYLKNDFPLFLEYDVGSLGFIRLGVSPHKKPDNW